VSTGDFTTCARLSNGELYCWGMNDYGATGHDCANVLAPSLVPLTGVTDAGTGWRTSCAATAEGVRCFGVPGFGKLGNGLCPGDCFVCQPVPQAVTGLGAPTDLGVFWDHTCALVGQQLSCWGYNGFGANGTGTLEPSHVVPAAVQW
jgi:hypothetical protein